MSLYQPQRSLLSSLHKDLIYHPNLWPERLKIVGISIDLAVAREWSFAGSLEIKGWAIDGIELTSIANLVAYTQHGHELVISPL